MSHDWGLRRQAKQHTDAGRPNSPADRIGNTPLHLAMGEWAPPRTQRGADFCVNSQTQGMGPQRWC